MNNNHSKISSTFINHQQLAVFSFKLLAWCFFTFIFSPSLFAQSKNDTVKSRGNVTLKLTPFFGPYKNNSKVIAADLMKMLKNNAVLIVKDEKGIDYPVVSFEITWRQKNTADDAVTGKPKTTYTMVGQTIKGNKINNDWIEEMGGLVKKGEDINFSTIIYFDAKKNSTFLIPSSLAIGIL